MRYTVILKENKDFLSAYRRGGYAAGRAVTVYYRKNGRGKKRLGITTGKKVGNAVVRSRCRRIIRAAYRENEALFPKGFDYVIVARPGCGDCKSTQISSFLKNKALPSVLRSMEKKKDGGRPSRSDRSAEKKK
ncbi:MAG: ribonuclease P protein component [Prevotella sp.]|nr:ribonuclease P protein component [Prevotella sp.]